MVDATDLTLAATIAQTIVISITLLVFIFQFRSQEKAIHESSYQNLMGRYNDLVMSQVTRERPSSLWTDRVARLTGGDREIPPEELEAYTQLLVIYGILEEAFILHKKKWVDKETWEQWAAWLREMAKDPRFMRIYKFSQGMFDKDFEEYLAKISRENAESKANV